MKTITSFVFYSDEYSVTVTPEDQIKANEILVSWNAVYSVFYLNSQSQDKISLIKMVRKYTGLGLKDAKYLVDDAQARAKNDKLYLDNGF